jgi:hypothetical protein
LRTYVRITPDVEKANRAIPDGTFERLLANTMEALKPEAAYFYAEHGKRTANLFFDLKDQSDIPRIAEPWFIEMNATVEFFPCMNADDVKLGLTKAMADMKVPAGV